MIFKVHFKPKHSMESFYELGQNCLEKYTPRKRGTFIFIRNYLGVKRDIWFVLTRKEVSHVVTDLLSSREEEFAIHPLQTTTQWRAVLSVGRPIYVHTHTHFFCCPFNHEYFWHFGEYFGCTLPDWCLSQSLINKDRSLHQFHSAQHDILMILILNLFGLSILFL